MGRIFLVDNYDVDVKNVDVEESPIKELTMLHSFFYKSI